MSHKKAAGSSRNGRESNSQRLGIKLFSGQTVKKGMILVRQRGTRIHPGTNVKRAKDDTLFAMENGKVKFTEAKRMRFDGKLKDARFVHVVTA